MNSSPLLHHDVQARVRNLGRHILETYTTLGPRVRLHPVGAGGSPVVYALKAYHPEFVIAEDAASADILITDRLDPAGQPPLALREKPLLALVYGPALLPWDLRAEELVERMLAQLGDDPGRGGLVETPARVAKAWRHWFSGYGREPADVLKTFEDGAEGVDELVLVSSIPVYSHCVVGSTFVETPRGRIPISRLRSNDWVYTVDPATLEISLAQCQNPRITRVDADLVRVYTDNDTLICTPDHKILLTDGTWVEAQNLKNNDRLVSLYRGVMAGGKGDTAYPTLISSRNTRWGRPLLFNGVSKQVTEHRFTVGNTEQHMITHHEDGRVWNNVPENLSLITTGEHNMRHSRTEKLAPSKSRLQAVAESSRRPEVRAQRSESLKQYWANLSQGEREYRSAIVSAGRKRGKVSPNHVVFGVESLDYQEDVWCMDVPGNQTFFANGIAVHNCEHHVAPIFGVAHVGYIPNRRIVGLSKLSRVVDVFARRLQVQERLTNQVADALWENLEPQGVGVVLECRHLCMESRGVQQQGTITTTSALRGCLKEEHEARSEFLQLIDSARKGRGTI